MTIWVQKLVGKNLELHFLFCRHRRPRCPHLHAKQALGAAQAEVAREEPSHGHVCLSRVCLSRACDRALRRPSLDGSPHVCHPRAWQETEVRGSPHMCSLHSLHDVNHRRSQKHLTVLCSSAFRETLYAVRTQWHFLCWICRLCLFPA